MDPLEAPHAVAASRFHFGNSQLLAIKTIVTVAIAAIIRFPAAIRYDAQHGRRAVVTHAIIFIAAVGRAAAPNLKLHHDRTSLIEIDIRPLDFCVPG
jgi:nitrate/nitrite transporter NarK